ncbi:hypothetical protein IT396_03650 [Candidatus Nomurabacteria bacterium]|nr:hypothetical protein [Candidatus Nomurabacteria bacterium]
MNLNWKLIGILIGTTALLVLVSWFLFGRQETPQTPPENFGSLNTQTDVSLSSGEEQSQNTNTNNAQNGSNLRIFKISDGPVAGATFVQTLNPTTTIARFVMADNGRSFDLPVDVPGAVPRVVSNTTIPGVAEVTWVGPAGILQYVNQNALKTLLLNLPAATTSTQSAPVRIQFLANDIKSIAVSPDATKVVYLLQTTTGSDGYIANPDGTQARKAFSLPFAQIQLVWPTQNTVLAYTAPAYGVMGMAFTIEVESGVVTPLLSAAGLSLSASWGLDRVVYHTTGGTAGRITYARNMQSGTNAAISFDPLPEQCIWSRTFIVSYCATAATYVPENYIDLYHLGTGGVGQQIVSYDSNNYATLIAIPGSADGGITSEIDDMALSPDERYLLYIKKGERSLWGVRLF